MWMKQTSKQVSDAIKFMEAHREDDEFCNVSYDKLARCWNAWYSTPHFANRYGTVGMGATAVDAAHNLLNTNDQRRS